MKNKWIKIGTPFLVLILGVAGMQVIGASGKEEEQKEEVDVRPTVQVEAVSAYDHQVTIIGHGEVKPLETTVLSAQVSGEVTKWHDSFVAGGLVKRGDVLFEIEKDEYQAALLQAQASLQSAKANLIEEQGRSSVARQEAKSLPKAKVTDLYLRKPQLLSAKAAVKSAEASLKIAKRNLANCKVVAPYDALVVSRELGTGQYVNRGTPVATLHNVEMAEVVFPIAGFDIPFLPEQITGLNAMVQTEGRYSLSRTGVIHRDLGVVDSATRMSSLVVQVADPYSIKSNQPKLRYGNYVTVKFSGQTLNQVFRLSQDIVANNAVWIVEDNKLSKRTVEVIREDGGFLMIGKGLNEQDQVVTTVPEYPKEGMEVKIMGQTDVANQEAGSENKNITATAEVN